MDTQLDITEFDAIIVGTGIEESLISSALARHGKQILHLDHKDFYGGTYSSLNLKQFHTLINNTNNNNNHELNQFNAQRLEPPLIQQNEDSEENEETNEYFFNQQDNIENNNNNGISLPSIPSSCTSRRHITIDNPYEFVSGSTSISEDLKSKNRQFMIDVAPKSLFSDGTLVCLLAETRIGKYLEFRCPYNVYMYHEDAFRKVPCSKSDVFQDKYIKMMEKRFLSKFLNFSMQSESEENQQIIQEYKDKPFLEFLKYHKLSPQLQQFTLYAIGMLHHNNNPESTSQITTAEGLERLNKYISSVGVFGRTAFLETCYGISEISQAFCRVSAVYGGIYILRRGILALNIQEDQEPDESSKERCVSVVTTNGQTITAPHFVMARDYRPEGIQYKKQRSVLRAVCIVDQKLLPEDDVSDAVIPPDRFGNERSIFMRQYGHPSGVCPKNQYLIHFSVYLSNVEEQKEQEEAAMNRALEHLFHINDTNAQQEKEDANDNQSQEQSNQEKDESEQRQESTHPPENNTNENENEKHNDDNNNDNNNNNNNNNDTSPSSPTALYYGIFHQYLRDLEDGEDINNNQQPVTFPHMSNVYTSRDPDGDPALEGIAEYGEQVFRDIVGTTSTDGEEKGPPFLPPMPDPEESLDHTSRVLGIEEEMNNNANASSSSQNDESSEKNNDQKDNSVTEKE